MDVVEVVGETVVVGASVFVSTLVSVFTSCLVSVWVCTELGTGIGVCTVTGEDGVIGADMLEAGLAGLRGDTGDAGFVTLVIDFTQLSDVVAQGCHTGCPYGSGHVEERVWVMLPV